MGTWARPQKRTFRQTIIIIIYIIIIFEYSCNININGPLYFIGYASRSVLHLTHRHDTIIYIIYSKVIKKTPSMRVDVDLII